MLLIGPTLTAARIVANWSTNWDRTLLTNIHIRSVSLRSNCVVHNVCTSTQLRYLEISMRLEFLEFASDTSTILLLCLLLHCLWVIACSNSPRSVVKFYRVSINRSNHPSRLSLYVFSFSISRFGQTFANAYRRKMSNETCHLITSIPARDRRVTCSRDLLLAQLFSDGVVRARLTVDSRRRNCQGNCQGESEWGACGGRQPHATNRDTRKQQPASTQSTHACRELLFGNVRVRVPSTSRRSIVSQGGTIW